MPKYLSHDKLKLTFAEYGAMLATRALIASGQLKHTTDGITDLKNHRINMRVACNVGGCGSVSCIGGTVAMIMGKNVGEAVNYVCEARPRDPITGARSTSTPLARLFFPPGRNEDWHRISGKLIVKAIDNFLSGAKHPWRGVWNKNGTPA